MRRFMAQVVTEIHFVGDDHASPEFAQGYEEHLATALQEAAQELSLRTVQGNKVVSVQVGEIKASV
jgi:hypothetical protein